MFLLRMLTRKGGRAMDPLHVSMTGVRMGESFLQIGCNDKSLLSGLAQKVGLSGNCAVAAFSAQEAKLAAAIGTKVGALIDIQTITAGGAWPFGEGQFDMVVIDNTGDTFGAVGDKTGVLRHALRALRPGGRLEVVTREKSANTPDYDFMREMTDAGFKPVRLLAERDGFRFIEGLRPNL